MSNEPPPVRQYVRCDWCKQIVSVTSRAAADHWLMNHDCPEATGHDVEVLDDGPDGYAWRCHTCGVTGWDDAGEDTGSHDESIGSDDDRK